MRKFSFTKLVYYKKDIEHVLSKKLGKAYQDYRKVWKKVSNFKLITATPVHIDFELNYSCNLRCNMCPHGIKETRRPSYYNELMDFKLFKKIIDEGIKYDLKAIRLSQLNEPLLREDLPEFIKYAKKSGIVDIMISTNGMLLDEGWSSKLIKSGLTQLKVSLDAVSPQTYNKVRTGGVYHTLIKNIHSFLNIRKRHKAGLPLLRVSFVRTKDNAHEVIPFIKLWEGVADYCAITDFSSWVEGDSKKNEKFVRSKNKLNTSFFCAQPWQRATVFPNGDLIPCCSEYFRFFPISNLKKRSLKESWVSPKLQRLRMLHKQGKWMGHPVCKKCVTNSSLGK